MVLAINMSDVVRKNGDKIDTKELSKRLGYPMVNFTFRQMAEEERKSISDQRAKVNPATGALTAAGSVPVPRSHHYGA